ncbi:MAG: hypothetical protein M3Z32_07455, partial [Acidobacteriota bacterium]|nr:hypothetical protein [Acidobacteriota bacterium]
AIFEAEAFNLYRRTGELPAPALTYLDMGAPAAARQLLSGFYPAEQHAWRWSARRFTVVLKAPEAARSVGATLELHLYVPPEQVSRLGPLTIKGDVNGYPLRAETFSSQGSFTYQCAIPPSAFKRGVAIASFAFDKAVPSSAGEGRELGAVISSLGFTPVPYH